MGQPETDVSGCFLVMISINMLKATDSVGMYSRYEYVYDAIGNLTILSDYKFEDKFEGVSKVLYRFTEKKYDGFN